MNKHPRIFFLCYPHLGELDSWLSVIDKMNSLAINIKFTLIIPNVMIMRNFDIDNAIVKISDSIFDEVLIQAFDDTLVKHISLFDSMKWYQSNHTILRLFDILKRLIKRRFFSNILKWPLILLRNKLYKGKCMMGYEELSGTISQIDILCYDVAAEINPAIFDVLQLFKKNKKYSISHALSMVGFEGEIQELDRSIHNKDNIKVYAHAKFHCKYYNLRYGVDINKIHVVGIPRHDSKWIKRIQEESSELPSNFDDDNSIVVLSRHVDSHLSYDKKFESLKNIKKIFIDRLGMKVIVKLHPSEKQEKIYSGKNEVIYEEALGRNNYGLTWVYSDLHAFALCKNKRLAISFYTGVVFDMVAMGTPCVEYIDLLIKIKNPEKDEKILSQFVKYGFIGGVSNYSDLCTYVDKWIGNSDQISTASMNTYKKYFQVSNNISEKIATEILHENNIIG